ncbi:MAG: ribonuclease P protein component [Acidimicrobiia bacterium]|nr:ribonuclease P protein component [Acidimicrobiia bacterium]
MIWRIRRRAIFTELRSEGQRVRSGGVRMTFCPQPDPQPLVAFAFGKKFGNAVERNRARRRLRAAFESAWDPDSAPLGAYLLAGDRSVLSAEFSTVLASVSGCLAQLADTQGTGRR